MISFKILFYLLIVSSLEFPVVYFGKSLWLLWVNYKNSSCCCRAMKRYFRLVWVSYHRPLKLHFRRFCPLERQFALSVFDVDCHQSFCRARPLPPFVTVDFIRNQHVLEIT